MYRYLSENTCVGPVFTCYQNYQYNLVLIFQHFFHKMHDHRQIQIQVIYFSDIIKTYKKYLRRPQMVTTDDRG